MNPEPPSISERSMAVRFFRWLFSWRGVRRMLIILAWIVTVIALLYAEENWRGRRAWNKQRQQLEARGEQVDLKEFIPKSVPDDQNFAATPFVAKWFDRKLTAEQLWADDYSRVKHPPQAGEAKNRRQLVNLLSWAAALANARSGDQGTNVPLGFAAGESEQSFRAKAAAAVLESFKASDDKLRELRAASQRPLSRYPVFYDLENPWGILLPHLARLKGLSQRLQLKACAELAAGQSSNALEDVTLALYVADSIKNEPFLISFLVRLACVQITAHSVWEGLTEHRWSDAELQALIPRLQQYNFVSDVKRPLDSERAAGVLTAELLYRNRKVRLSDLLGESSDRWFSDLAANAFARLAPHGWYHQEQLNYCRLFSMQTAGTFDPASRRVFPQQIAAHDRELQHAVRGGVLGRTLYGVLHHQLVAALLLPAIGNVPRRAAAAQITADQCAIACALERHRLANGQFPEKLEALAPRFIPQLPNDPFTGTAYVYQRDDKGFVLYSVGWNETDDGGVPGRTRFDDKGDWVWESQRN